MVEAHWKFSMVSLRFLTIRSLDLKKEEITYAWETQESLHSVGGRCAKPCRIHDISLGQNG